MPPQVEDVEKEAQPKEHGAHSKPEPTLKVQISELKNVIRVLSSHLEYHEMLPIEAQHHIVEYDVSKAYASTTKPIEDP